jgi:membrane protease YdiL (CAAX protease family)
MDSRDDLHLTPAYREGKHKLKSIRWMLFFVVMVQTVVTVIAGVIASFFAVPPPVYLQLLVIELLAYLLPISLYAKENRILTERDIREQFGLKRFRMGLLPWIVLAGFGCQFVMILLNLPVNLLLSESDGYIPSTLWELSAAILVIGVVPAVFEEFLLRGIVYGVMADYNSRVAILFTAVMFALMHGNPAGFVGYLFFGVVLVILLRRTGSLYACMLFHLTNNVTAILLSYFSNVLMDTPVATLKLFVTGVVAAAAGWLALLTVTKRPRPVLRMKTSEFLGQSFVNLPILLCIFSILALFFFA